ncbi:MAG: U32 family peptidase [Muribaculaceae bacterium]|nr:U32 family peptidase [Muribaculaceae bacterium]
MTSQPRPLELLAPARTAAIAREAILHGADAVYIGAPSHGARAKAGNSIEEIKDLVKFATPYGVKVYVTVNTIIYDDELADVERMIWDLYAAGVDALIVQDMALLQMNLPPIQLHASTQCDTRDAAKARWLQDAGMSQIVIARETDLDTIRDIHTAVDVPLEAFVHGALCVSYSGDCRASQILTGRSANRGACAQMCRLPYTLIDGNGNVAGRKHYLSLRDMNRIAFLGEMADAGVSSFKIEGRLKDASYVKEVTLAYRRALDRLIDANPLRYCRASRGVVTARFMPDLRKSFNRGYTDYFLHAGTRPAVSKEHIASLDSPKALGEQVGKIRSTSGAFIDATLSPPLANGDGLSYITSDGVTGGFRVNRAEGRRIFPAERVSLPAGTKLYRSYDKDREDMLAGNTATRLIPVDLTVSRCDGGTIALSGTIEGVGTTTVTAQCNVETAKSDPAEHRRRQLSKWGDTIFTIANYNDRLGNDFIAASLLSELRRRLASALLSTLEARKTIARPGTRNGHSLPPEGTSLTHRSNVANRLAEEFYRSCGVTAIEPAIEVKRPSTKKPLTLMETRYCLRRELGACLKDGGNDILPEPLTLRGQGFETRLEFDCKNCKMRVNYLGK